MKICELSAWGFENLHYRDVATPQPGPDQVLLKFGAASVNYRDYQIVAGEFAPAQPLPIIPGSDGAGQIVATGDNVDGLSPGDRVSPLFFPEWMSGEALGNERSVSTGLETLGVLREYGLYEQHQVCRVAPHLTDAEASCYPCAGLTAWNSLVTLSGITAGDTVLVQGTGGVAIMALQMAKAMGAQLIVTSSSNDRLQRALALGADHGINYRETPNWGEAARKLTDGRGVDAVIEIGGEGTLPQSITALRRGGHINVIGYLAGIGLGLTVFDLIERNANIHGLSVGNREQFEEMMDFVSEHDIRPVIGRTYSFDKAGQAIQDIARGGNFGKLVVTI
ncbi:MAG: NAD(P)-dependent alcohol dehydrogenase [Proteobacteria bacterium]|nr:NAD(P)-dependent alcohol dehydrogenase [Pseudomonadota bacterium]